jgi:hypothetical protein
VCQIVSHQYAKRSSRTFQTHVGVWILLDGRQVVFVVLIADLHNVAIGVVSRRVALEDVPAVAGMLDSLDGRLVWTLAQSCRERTFLYGRWPLTRSVSPWWE